MTVYYLDSSAWVKRYLSEPGSAWVRRLFDGKEPLACCPLGCNEVAAAIARQQGVQKISADRQVVLVACRQFCAPCQTRRISALSSVRSQ